MRILPHCRRCQNGHGLGAVLPFAARETAVKYAGSAKSSAAAWPPGPQGEGMNAADKYDVVVLGSGTGGKLMARAMAQEGTRTAVVERRYIGGSCVNISCLPSKNVIHTAKVASLVRRHQEFGIQTGPTAVNMSGVYARKRKMVDEIVQVHLDRYEAAGD